VTTKKSRRRRPVTRGSVEKGRARIAEETLAAIGAGRVDALVVAGPNGGKRTVSIESATHPYALLLDAMGDGSALLDPGGSILFCNQTFGEIAQASERKLIGSAFQTLFESADRARIDEFLRAGSRKRAARDFTFTGRRGGATPVSLTIAKVPLDTHGRNPRSPRKGATILMVIVTDLTLRRTADATRARLLERLISAEDEERRRIALELHDETGQSLAALQVGLRLIADHAESSDVRDRVLRLRDIVAGMVSDVSRLARGLHPAVLDDNGLAAASATYVADYAKSHSVKVSFVAGELDSPRLVPFAAATVYRILQEALTNVARHARATRVIVEMTRDEAGIGLLVRDNGVGFDASLSHRRSGLGLRGMRERVELLRGSIRIDSAKRRGTTVRARIPLERAGA
jgi:signal transduction histidine kinase